MQRLQTYTDDLTDGEFLNDISGRLGKYYDKINNILIYHEPGLMTAREVMQFVGTEIFRRMYGDVWADALLRKINNDGPGIALISDVRFPNEVFGLQRSGGVVVRFTRNNDSPDKHPSETSLDKEVFDWDNFNHIIDKKDVSIEEQNKEVYSLMYSLGLFQEEKQD